MKKQEIYEKAFETYGIRAQLIMLLEEMSELQQDITRYLNYKGGPNFSEEIADVLIMLEQIIHGMNLYKEVGMYKAIKLNRLAERIRLHGKSDAEVIV